MTPAVVVELEPLVCNDIIGVVVVLESEALVTA